MPIHDVQYSFSGGEVSPLFTGRGDVNRYQASLSRCENWVMLPKGGASTRAGTQFVADATSPTSQCRLERFEFSIEQAYVFAFGPRIVQVFLPSLEPLLDGGSPVTIGTPYLEADIFSLQMTQSADVMYIVHPSYAPAKISRLTASTFAFTVINHRPAPFLEKDTDLETTVTLGATTGTDITFTAGALVFLAADVGRQIISGLGTAIITTVVGESPSAVCECTIIRDFSSVGPLASGDWFLTGSPACQVVSSETQPVGNATLLSLSLDQNTNTNLVVNGDFVSGALGWTNHSGLDAATAIASGTATGGSDTSLVDSGATFLSRGILAGHIARNFTTGEDDQIVQVVSDIELLTATGAASFSASDLYEIRPTGTGILTGGDAVLLGGVNGHGWIETSVTVVTGRLYRIVFDVLDAPVSMMAGSTTRAADVVAEATHPIGNEQGSTFTAPSGGTVFLAFRNNQNARARIDNVSVREESLQGFRDADVGKYVSIRNGIVQISTIVDNGRHATGVLLAPLDDTTTAGIGAWVLGESSWSVVNGFPRALSFHEGRLWYFGTMQQPLTCWGSVVGGFEEFSLGVLDDDAVDIEISANQMNTIEWAEPFRDLYVGTRGGIHLLTGGTNPITPTNKAQIPQDTEGSPPLRPVRVGDRLFHVSRGRRQLRELTVLPDTGLSRIQDVTILADHITESGITQLAYQAEPSNILWGVRTDGQLIGYSFELEEEVRGWHRHVTAGLFESVMVLPVDNGVGEETQQVWCVVVRDGQRRIEVMRPDETTATTRRARLTLDSAIRYDGVATSTFTGLAHLEGERVTLVAREAVNATLPSGATKLVDRLVQIGTATVVGGAVTTDLPHTRVDIGLPFIATARTLPPERELRSGTLFGRKERWAEIRAKLYETQGLTIDGRRVGQRTTDDLTDTYILPQTATVSGVGQGWAQDNSITLVQADPFPATVLALSGALEFEEVD